MHAHVRRRHSQNLHTCNSQRAYIVWAHHHSTRKTESNESASENDDCIETNLVPMVKGDSGLVHTTNEAEPLFESQYPTNRAVGGSQCTELATRRRGVRVVVGYLFRDRTLWDHTSFYDMRGKRIVGIGVGIDVCHHTAAAGGVYGGHEGQDDMEEDLVSEYT